MLPSGPAKLLSIYVNHGDKWHHEPLHLALMDRARRAGLGGVTLLHAEGGIGSHHVPHTGMNEILMAQMPVMVQIIDKAEAIAGFLPAVREMVPEGLVTVSDVEVVAHELPPLAGHLGGEVAGTSSSSGACTVGLDTSVKDLARKLLADDVRYLYVVDATNRVIGVVGRRDLLLQVLPPHPSGLALLVDGLGTGELHQRIERAHGFTAEQVMAKPVLSVPPDAPSAAAVKLMLDHGLLEVPILQDGKLVGVVTQQDVLRQQLADAERAGG